MGRFISCCLSYFLTPFIQGRAKSSFSLSFHLRQLILARGPLTVFDFMRESLTNPLGGYYMHCEALGQQGDFITSPEISQLFGELVGVWCLHVWRQNGSVRPLHVVELGPGRGTLAGDVLRTLSQFGDISNDVSVSLVEVSPRMRRLQRQQLAGESHPLTDNGPSPSRIVSRFGAPVSWYNTINDVPSEDVGFTVFLANEFLDALPVHQFVKRDGHWREILVDINHEPSEASVDLFRFVVSPVATPSLSYMMGQDVPSDVDCYEVCPDARVVIQRIAKRLSKTNGIALIADYGSDPPHGLTLRGFKGHDLHDVLDDPGSADLTADVDFAALRRAVGRLGVCCGPISQALFLHQMGIEMRLSSLLSSVSVEQGKELQSGYEMLTASDKMGERFKFFVVLPPNGSCPYPFHMTS